MGEFSRRERNEGMKEFYQMTSQEAKIATNGSEAPLQRNRWQQIRESTVPNALV